MNNRNTPNPRPKALKLSILVDWSNHKEESLHPCWLAVHFGPPPSAFPRQQTQMAGVWQYTFNIFSAEKTPMIKKQNEESIPNENRALLWFNAQPHMSRPYVTVKQHVRFPPALMPRVIALHADRAESDANALVYVKKKTSQKRHKEDSYVKVVRGHICHLHITFPDGSLVNQYIAQGWGFTASLFTYKRKRDHIEVSPSRAVTQIRANWLDFVEPDPDPTEIEAARINQVEDLAEEANAKSGTPRGHSAVKRVHSAMTAPAEREVVGGVSLATADPNPAPMLSATPGGAGAAAAAANASFYSADNPSVHYQYSSSVDPQPSVAATSGKRADEWTQGDLDTVVFSKGTASARDLPDYAELPVFEPHVELGFEVDAFFDAPSAPPQAPSLSTSDREVLLLFRALEQKAKSVATDSNNDMREAAIRLTQVLSASGQLGGWKHVEEFMADQDLYARKTQAVERKLGSRETRSVNPLPATPASAPAKTMNSNQDSSVSPQEPRGKIDKLSDSSQTLLRNAMKRAKWVVDIEKRNKQLDGKTLERVLGVLQHDGKWMTDSAAFLKGAEQEVSTLINMNPTLFAQFRGVQSRGVQWPHSQHLRRNIERAGFVFRPMMIKRDRCVCEACGVEMSGWRPWHNPWLFHDWSKRHPFAPPPGTVLQVHGADVSR